MIVAKDHTISELKDMLQMMEPSTRTACNTDRLDEMQGKCKMLEKQNKILKIENECLISVI